MESKKENRRMFEKFVSRILWTVETPCIMYLTIMLYALTTVNAEIRQECSLFVWLLTFMWVFFFPPVFHMSIIMCILCRMSLFLPLYLCMSHHPSPMSTMFLSRFFFSINFNSQ
uniref:Uncharacterized protein n=1 Tax=Cacopsylla melanoneura TaxID=428564 RepID=A0A8D9B7I1_9HEMI